MRRIALSVAALTAMGFLASAAQAETLNGAASKQGNQCFKFTSGDQVRDSRFGAWSDCPAPAAAPVVHKKKHASR